MKSLASRRQMMKTVPPDPNCTPTLESMRQNPKFARLLGFSVNNLSELLKTINPKHRVNAYFIIQEKGHQNLVQALKDHKKNESLVYSVVECLVRIISSSKQFQEEYCQKIIEVGAPLALHELINTINKNSEAMRLTMPLIGYLAGSRASVQQLIEAGLMDDCVNIIRDPSVDEDVSRAAMETLIKFTSHPKAKQELIKPGFVKSIIDLIEQRIKDKNTVLAGLRILSSVLSINEGYELLKTDSLGTKIIVKVLENHPEDRAINNVSANALEKLATIEDIENALNAVKAGNTSQVSLLGALLLVEDLLRYVVNKGGILDLIHVMEKQLSQGQLESVSLVKSCATALGRIATSDTKYINEIFQHNGLEAINKAFATDNSEIVQACCDTIQKFAVDERTAEEIVSKGTVSALIARFQTQGSSDVTCQSLVEALGSFGRFAAGRKEVVDQKGPHKTLTVIKDWKNKKEVQEGGIKALSKLITDAYTAVDLIEDGIIDHLAQITKANPQWRKLNIHTVNVFEQICQLGNSSSKLDKAKVFEVLVDIVTTGVSSGDLAQSIESSGDKSTEEAGADKPKEDKKQSGEDKLTEKQELELRNAAVLALEEITNVEDVHEMKIDLEDASQTFAKAPVPNAVKALQKQINIFSTIALLPKIAELLITGGIPEKIARNAKIANAHPAFPGKPEIIRACTMFFEHLAHHGPREELRDLLVRPNVKQAGLEAMMVGLNKDTDQKIALMTMKAGSALINARILDSKDKFAVDQIQGKTGPKGDKEASAEKFIGAVLSTIKKFEDEEIQVAGLNLLTTAANMDKGFIQYIMAQGGTRLAVSNLESMNTTLEQGRHNLQLITSMIQDPEAVKLLKNQNAGQAIMSFLSANQNPQELAKLVAPILETLAAEHAEQEIEEILAALSGVTDDQDPLLLAETMEHVANLTLTDKNNELFLKKNALPVFLFQLKRELDSNVETLAAQGVLEIHQRTVTALLSSIVRIRDFANQNPETNVDDLLIEENILDSLATLFKTRPDFMQAISHGLPLTTSYYRNQKTTEQVLKKFADSAIVSSLTSFLETYKNEEVIINNATELLLAISNKYPDLVSKMGQKSFVRALIKETKTALKLGEDDPSALNQANQNLRCLVTMADNPDTLATIIEEGGQNLSISVVDRYIKENKKTIATRTRAVSTTSAKDDTESRPASTTEHLVSNSIELLDKILDVPKEKRAAVSSSVPNDLLNILDDCQNPEIGLNALKIVEKASRVEDFATALSENDALEKIMGSISTFPNNPQVIEIVGQVITNLGANAMIPQVAEQVIELAQTLNAQDADSVEALSSALDYYNNLLSAPRDPEVEGDSSKRVSEALQASLEAAKSDSDLLLSHVKILEKLSIREPEVRTQIRESATSRTLVGLLGEKSDNQSSSKVLKVVKALSSSIPEPQLTIDGQTGEERLRREEGDGFLHSFILNEGAPIEKLLQALQQQNTNSQTIVDALTLLNEVTTCNEKAKNDVIKQNGASIIVDVNQNRLTGSHARQDGATLALRVLSNLTHDKEAYTTILGDNLIDRVVRDLLEFKYEPVIEGTQEIAHIEAGLTLLTNLSDNTFDHILLKEKKAPDAILGLLEKFRQVSKDSLSQKTEGVTNAYKVVSHAQRALRKMFADALIGRSLLKTQGKEHILGTFNTLVETTVAPEEIDAEKLAQLTEISPQSIPLNQCIQDTLAVIETLAAHSKFGKEFSLLDEESTLYSDILTLMSNIPDDSAASYRTLQITKHNLQSLGKEKILENQESLSPLSDVADTLISLYTSLPVMISLGEDVKSLTTVGLTKEEALRAEEEAKRIAEEAKRIAEEARKAAEEEERLRKLAEEEAAQRAAEDAQKAAEDAQKALEAAQKAAEERAEQERIRIEQEKIKAEQERIRLEEEKYDNTIRQAKEDFSFLADLLEELIPKTLKGQATEKDTKLLIECSEILKEHVRQEDKVAKVEQHDLIAPLSQVLSHAGLNRNLKDNFAEVFTIIAQNNDQSAKLAASSAVITGLSDYIKQDGVQALAAASTDDSHEVRCIVGASETLETLIEVARLTITLPQGVNISGLTSNLTEVVEPACNRQGSQVISSITRTLATLATLNEESAQVIETAGSVEKIMDHASKFDQDAKFARSYALLIASNATNHVRRTNYAQRGVFDKLHASTEKFSNDLELGLNTCLALTSLITGHEENVKLFINSPSIQYLGKLLAQFPDNALLVETIARLLNTITSIHTASTEKLGEIGATEWLTNLFRGFTQDTQDASIVESLKAVRNLLTTKENAARFIDQGFVPALQSLTAKHSSPQVGLLALSILGALASLSDADKTAKAIEDGSIEIISKLTAANQTDRTTLVITTDNLKHFAKDQTCSQLVAQRGGLDMTLKILTTQDFDTELIQKSLNLLSGMLDSQEIITSALEADTLSILNNLISTQRKSPEVLATIFQIIEKLSIDQDHALKIYQSGFLQAAFKAAEEGSLDQNTTHALNKSLLKLSESEDVAALIGEAGSVTILKQLESNVDSQPFVETTTKLTANLLEAETNVDVIVNNRGVEILNTVMAKYPEDERIAVQVYKALSLIALHSDQMRQEMVNSDMKKNVEEMQTYFQSENKTEALEQLGTVLENLTKATEIQKEHDEQNKPAEEPVEEKAEEPAPPVVEEKKEEDTKNLTAQQKRDKTLNLVKNDPQLKDAWAYIFRGKILKFWTPHGTNWPMHLLLSDDGFGIVLRGKKKWETTVRLDDIDGIWKGYFNNSPFAHPQGLFTRVPAQELCFFFNTYATAPGGVKTLHFECQNPKEREMFVDYLVQILRRLKILVQEQKDREQQESQSANLI